MRNIDKETRSYHIEDFGEKIVINVCVGSACHLKGSYDVINEFKKYIPLLNLEKRVSLKGAFCLNNCTNAVSMKVNNLEVDRISPEEVKGFLECLAEVKKWNI